MSNKNAGCGTCFLVLLLFGVIITYYQVALIIMAVLLVVFLLYFLYKKYVHKKWYKEPDDDITHDELNIPSHRESKQKTRTFHKEDYLSTEELWLGLGFGASTIPIKKFPRKYVSVDIETTGLDPYEDDIVEIGAVRFKDGKEVSQFSTFAKPKAGMSSEAYFVNHISEDMLKDAPSVKEAIDKFVRYCRDDILVGHNIDNFDILFLRNAAEDKLNTTLNNNTFDTLYWSNRVFDERLKLKLLCERCDVQNEQKHRALNDARATAKCLEVMYNKVLQVSEDPNAFTPAEDGKLKGQVICFTGNHPFIDRHDLMDYVSRHGGELSRTVTLKTTKLVNIGNVDTTKVKKARKYHEKTGVIMQDFDDWVEETELWREYNNYAQ